MISNCAPLHRSAFCDRLSILCFLFSQDRQFRYPHQLAGAVSSIGATERTPPRAQSGRRGFNQIAAQMHERTGAQRFASRFDFASRWNHVQVCAVRNDFLRRNGRRHFVFVPVEAHALRDLQSIEHALIRHRSPAQGKIDRNEGGLPIPSINFAVQEARIELEMGQRFQVEGAAHKLRIHGRGLLRFRGNQNPGRVIDWPMEIIPAADGDHNSEKDAKRFHKAGCRSWRTAALVLTKGGAL